MHSLRFIPTITWKNFNRSSLKRLNSINSTRLESSMPSYDDSLNEENLIRRSILYVPGNDRRKIDKAIKSSDNIDSIVLDCEDGVAINSKIEARQTILKILNEFSSNERLWSKLSVRINSIDSGLAADDLNLILSGNFLPRTILLPKVDTKSNIDQFVELFQNNLSRKTYQNVDKKIDLITYVESAVGLLDLRDICQHTKRISESARLVGVVFGSDDFCANIGASRSNDGQEVLLARQQVILVAKSMNLQAIDSVYINFKDLTGLERQCVDGARMGFTGKQCIHPDQVPVIQNAYSPSDDKIDWAKGLVAEFELAQETGKGAFVYRGQMIDMPLLKQAFNILNIAKQIGKA